MSVTDPFAMRTPHSSSAHVASVEILHSSASRSHASVVQMVKTLSIFPCFRHLFLKGDGALINRLQLRKMRVKDADNLGDLHDKR
jgi:hypothetical protein